MGGDHRHAALDRGNEQPRIGHGTIEAGQRLFPTRVTEQRQLMMRQRLVKRNAPRVGRIEILHDRQPFQQHRARRHAALDFRDGVLAIRMNRTAKQHLFMPSDKLDDVVILDEKMRIGVVSFPVSVIHRVKRENDCRVQLFRASAIVSASFWSRSSCQHFRRSFSTPYFHRTYRNGMLARRRGDMLPLPGVVAEM